MPSPAVKLAGKKKPISSSVQRRPEANGREKENGSSLKDNSDVITKFYYEKQSELDAWFRVKALLISANLAGETLEG